MESSLPPNMNVFDAFFDVGSNSFKDWRYVYNYFIEEKAAERQKKNLLSITIPTQEYVRMDDLLDRILEIKKPCLIFGPTAQGKSVLMRNYVYEKDIPTKLRRYDMMGFSVNTNSKKLLTLFESRLKKVSRVVMAPPEERHQVFFIDDIHMAQKDRWGDSNANELIRQHLDYNGWYNTDKIYFKKVNEINFVASMSTRQQNKEIINERLGWHFAAVGLLNA